MSLSPDEVYDLVLFQVSALKGICEASGVSLHHVKAHGALYNQAARDAELAGAIARAVAAIDNGLVFYGLSGSALIEESQKLGLQAASEAFADRTYRSDGSLTPRTEPGALITDPRISVAQVVQMVTSQTVIAATGETVPIRADTICIHGDGKNALELAKAINRSLSENSIGIRPI
jgi:UPF0271 protein